MRKGPRRANLMMWTLVTLTAHLASDALEFYPPRKHPPNARGAFLAGELNTIAKENLTETALRKRHTPGLARVLISVLQLLSEFFCLHRLSISFE